MNFRNISAWSIRNPVVPIVLFLFLTVAGIVSFSTMKVQNTPDIEFPLVIVSIAQPGAAPTEIETQITQRVESAMRSIAGVDTITSTAAEGNSQTFVLFKLGENLDAATSEVKNAIDQVRGDLPDGILEPKVVKARTSSDPIAYFAVSADDMTIEQLSWFIDDSVAKRLLTVPGMAEVSRSGGVNREIAVTLDPARMQALGVTASQINAALRQVNINSAGGKAEVAGSRQSIRVLGNASSPYALSRTEIPLPGGRTVQLSDVATVTDSYSEVTSLAKVRDNDVVTFSIARARGESDVSVYDDTLAMLARIEKEQGGKVHFDRLFTSVEYTKGQYDTSIESMVEGSVLAVVVVFFFLRDWRATFVSALAIPLSAIPTFWFMKLMGFTLNELSLLALGLVAGVLVDDAIVEIENIVRHMRMGKSAYQASIDAADEIGLAVVATTFSIVAVFLPVGLMPGISGQFFKNFGLTVVGAVLMSLLVARMITPMVAAYFLQAKGKASHGEGPMMDRYMRILRWSLETGRAQAYRATLRPARLTFGIWLVEAVVVALVIAAFFAALVLAAKALAAMGLWAIVTYVLGLVAGIAAAIIVGKALSLGLRVIGGGLGAYHAYFTGRWRARLRDHRIWMMGVGAGSLALTVMLFMVSPSEFFPTTDSDFSRLSIEMVPGTTIAQTEQVGNAVAQIINRQPEVNNALLRVNEGNARMFINFKKERARTSMEFERELTPALQKIPDARVSFQDPNSQGPGSASGRAISVMLSGSNPVLLQQTAQTLVDQMSDLKQVVAPRLTADMRRPEIIITPRLELAASLGVTTQALSQTIRIATIGEIDQNSAKFSLSDRQVPIRVKLPVLSRRDLSTIANLPVPTASGGSVPLSRVADIGFGSGPISIQRYNQNRRVFVGADLPPGLVKSDADKAIKALPIMRNLPQGVSSAPAGNDKIEQEMLDNVSVALPAGILLVFSVLVLLYRKFISPLVNMGSLFLAPLGGLIALLIAGQPVSMPVFIGVLMLFGIVAKNSILLIDFAIEEMDKGTAKLAAVIEAGHKRAQPIVMTTVAMVAGMIPTSLSLGGDGAWRAPMGTTVIGGLILSTVLTLLIVPAGFSLADGLEKRLGPWFGRKILTFNDGDDRSDRGRAAVPAE